MEDKIRIFILGAGFGTALAVMLAGEGHDVTLWTRNEADAKRIFKTRTNSKLLKGVMLPESVKVTSLTEGAGEADVVLIAVPSSAVESTAAMLSDKLAPSAIIVNVAKGFADDKLTTLSEIIKKHCKNSVVTLSGPSHAEELARGKETAVVASSEDMGSAEYIQKIFSNAYFRIYTNPDLKGVEIGGAVKNIVAIAAGIGDGMGLGDNAKAALITRGLNEIAMLGVSLGANKYTFAGLSCLGDLIVTANSVHSRNYQAGLRLGKGETPDEAVKNIGMTVEGALAVKRIHDYTGEGKPAMPVCEQIYAVLYEGKNPADAVKDLMSRPKKQEHESLWLDY